MSATELRVGSLKTKLEQTRRDVELSNEPSMAKISSSRYLPAWGLYSASQPGSETPVNDSSITINSKKPST